MPNQWLVLFGLFLIAAALWRLHVEATRRRGFRRLAADMGATFRTRDREGLRERFAELALWQYGHAHEVSHVVKDSRGPVDFACFSDSFDVGFGRERVRRTHIVWVAATGVSRPGMVLIREGHFTPCGPHARYVPQPRVGEPAPGRGEPGRWPIWSEPGDDAETVWNRLKAVYNELSGPCLIETRNDLMMICRPGQTEPDEYRRTIELGLELVRSLSE